MSARQELIEGAAGEETSPDMGDLLSVAFLQKESRLTVKPQAMLR